MNQVYNCKNHSTVTLILKLVDYCNFVCDFCRYPNNPCPNTMTFDMYKTVVEKACDYNVSQGIPRLSIVYHGGEPLLWGLERFKQAIQFQNELKEKYKGIQFRNSIQTNGSLLTLEWIDFFKKNNFNIGISIDGPEEINFHKDANGSDIVLENIRLLNEAECHFGILSVITNEHAGWADKYYDFLIENNIHSVGFCYCIYDEENKITVKNSILSAFLKRIFDLYFNGEYQLSIREFDSVIKLCLGDKTNMCTFSYRTGCGNYFSIRPDGDVLFCDPYTLGKKALGNIETESFFEIVSKPELLAIKKDARNSVIKECDKCEIREICGGGCYRNLFGGDKNAFCETFKAVYPFIKESVLKSKELIERSKTDNNIT